MDTNIIILTLLGSSSYILYKYKYNIIRNLMNLYTTFNTYKNRGLHLIETVSLHEKLHIHKFKHAGKEFYIFHEKEDHEFVHDTLIDELTRSKQNNILYCEIGSVDITEDINKFKYHFDKEDNVSTFDNFLKYIETIYTYPLDDKMSFITPDLNENIIYISDIKDKKFKEFLDN